MTTATIHIDARSQAKAIRASRRDARTGTSVVTYTDSESAPRWMAITGGTLLVAGAALTALVFGWPGSAPEVSLAIPGLLGTVVGTLLISARSGVEITPDHVVLHFRPLPRRRIARHRIAAARLVEADARTYGGIGLRIGRRRRAVLLSPGVGIELTDDHGRVTFIRTARPEAAFRALVSGSGPGGRGNS